MPRLSKSDLLLTAGLVIAAVLGTTDASSQTSPSGLAAAQSTAPVPLFVAKVSGTGQPIILSRDSPPQVPLLMKQSIT